MSQTVKRKPSNRRAAIQRLEHALDNAEQNKTTSVIELFLRTNEGGVSEIRLKCDERVPTCKE